jgi:hypothetical protein
LIDFEDQECSELENSEPFYQGLHVVQVSDQYKEKGITLCGMVLCDSEIAHSGSRYFTESGGCGYTVPPGPAIEMRFEPSVQWVRVWAGHTSPNMTAVSMDALDRDGNIISVVERGVNRSIDTSIEIYSDKPNISGVRVYSSVSPPEGFFYPYYVYIDDIYFQELTSLTIAGGEGGSSSGSPSSIIRTDVPDIDFTTYPPKIKPVPSVDGHVVIDDDSLDKIVIVPGDVYV